MRLPKVARWLPDSAAPEARPMQMNKHSIKTSIYALLSGSTPSRVAAKSAARKEDRMEDIRDAMLQELRGAQDDHPQVLRRIRQSTDIQTLWYLRGDTMSILAARHGETEARRRMARITAMFHGLLPRGLSPRSSSSSG